MSIKAMMHVWENSKQRGSALVVMLALADMANDDGECYPGKAKLATKCRVNVRNLTMILQKLECDGELAIVHRRSGPINQSNIYKLALGGGVVIPRSLGSDHQITRGSDPTITRVVIVATPDPLNDPESDPSEKRVTSPILEILKKRGDLPQ